ncbi:hypothetical protein [uncultured Alsobacter sp.]|uniref:hypothetical protein n=1 Tax=uncultured Alsobacter sp. TaxID=1748258 RepID=UPI0025E4AA79|nr:hypothetical protein [uncultured Alsobacter sp.]
MANSTVIATVIKRTKRMHQPLSRTNADEIERFERSLGRSRRELRQTSRAVAPAARVALDAAETFAQINSTWT